MYGIYEYRVNSSFISYINRRQFISICRNATNRYTNHTIPILFWLGIIILFYHIFKVYTYIKQGKGYWVNLIHILLVGPLLIYIGYNREKTARLYFELLLMLGFSAIGYIIHDSFILSHKIQSKFTNTFTMRSVKENNNLCLLINDSLGCSFVNISIINT